jgi:hypothetical protein
MQQYRGSADRLIALDFRWRRRFLYLKPPKPRFRRGKSAAAMKLAEATAAGADYAHGANGKGYDGYDKHGYFG